LCCPCLTRERLFAVAFSFTSILSHQRRGCEKGLYRLGLGVAVISAVCLTEEDQGKLQIAEIPLEDESQTLYGVFLRERKYIGNGLKGLLTHETCRESKAPY